MFNIQNSFFEKIDCNCAKNAVLICIWCKNGVQKDSISPSLVAEYPYKNIITLFFPTIYTKVRNIINLLPHLVEAYTAKCIRCIKTLALSLLRSKATLAFQASFLSLCFLELVALLLGKILPEWLILHLWNLAEVFPIEFPKWCQRVFLISKKMCSFWTYAS